MSRRILIVVGHPDRSPDRLCRGLARAYGEGAEKAGHAVRQVDLAALDFPMLRTMQEFEHGAVPDSLKDAAQAIVWAEHIVFFFPLWLGSMPAMLKAFLEQVMRPGTAFAYPDKGSGFTRTLLRGRSARVVVTMGMPSVLYRLWFLGHGIAGMRRSILHFVGISPVRETLFGMVAGASDATRAKWIGQMRKLGERGL
ncbi:NAD(P)H-dependent oxidoreductase [Mesorhizobium sp. PAMC28654]|uniref:NAD(P)H-dependent oxidoreductase n=1 Tax=Mesorhizobium sp. PAMC28654 TaxID=2880934 RepID=UPI001D0B141B|nr:NAD(P)H-dependent oxidoreductase [Mesorhizobium sp. PAMC28654]UDL90712.1 NAD(P)H-dependent oxidoreductase [Mesorhizobium sp. PAMC28654]